MKKENEYGGTEKSSTMKQAFVLLALLISVSANAVRTVSIDNGDGVRIDYEVGEASVRMIPRTDGVKYAGILTIPDSVQVDGKWLTVTEIDNKAFEVTNTLSGVVLPQGITSVSMTECHVLSWVKCRSAQPPTLVVDDVLGFNLPDILLFVPEGSESKYQTAKNWKDFRMIWETPFVEDSVTNLRCEVTGMKSGVIQLQVIGDTESNREELYVPANIEYRDEDCQIVSIAERVFSGNETLSSVSFETNSLKELGEGAFAGCVNLKEVTCYAMKPPKATASVFEGVVPRSVVLRDGTEGLYMAADGWKQLLERKQASPVGETDKDDAERTWKIYDVSGNFQGRGRLREVLLPKGMYILVSDGDKNEHIVRKYLLQHP